MKHVLVALTLLTIGCTTVPEDQPPEMGAGVCDASRLGDLVGRPATQELGAEALRRSRAGALRWIRPGDAVTMDYRSDRLNINLDARGRIESFNCG